MKKDKEKVIDEVWTVEHVRSFLDARSYDGTDTDFHALLKAYQSMRESDFELFVDFFCEQKRNLDATDRHGRSVLDIISSHRHGKPYADILRNAGAAG
ncbi:MAG: PA4642 family protein [Halioglobus sp.]|nr:PA4642 family protein [Halioglobus sp.]